MDLNSMYIDKELVKFWSKLDNIFCCPERVKTALLYKKLLTGASFDELILCNVELRSSLTYELAGRHHGY